jgi:hypothetical protein
MLANRRALAALEGALRPREEPLYVCERLGAETCHLLGDACRLVCRLDGLTCVSEQWSAYAGSIQIIQAD